MMDGFIAEGKEAAAWSTKTGGLELQLFLPQDASPQACGSFLHTESPWVID